MHCPSCLDAHLITAHLCLCGYVFPDDDRGIVPDLGLEAPALERFAVRSMLVTSIAIAVGEWCSIPFVRRLSGEGEALPTRVALLVTVVVVVVGVLSAVSGIAFLRWLRAAYRDVARSGSPSPWSAFGATLAFVVPIANYVAPFFAMRSLVEASNPDVYASQRRDPERSSRDLPPAPRAVPPRILPWLIAWNFPSLLPLVSDSTAVFVVAPLASVAAAILAGRLLRAIDDRIVEQRVRFVAEAAERSRAARRLAE